MRSMLAGAVGLSLGLGSLAVAQSPSAQLGRPVPAAQLGRPTPVYGANGQQPFQPANYRPTTIIPPDTAPLLAPIVNNPDEPLPAPRPMPSDGTGGSTAVPPPGAMPGAMPSTPYYGPAYGPVAGPDDCATCNNGVAGGAFMGDPYAGQGGWGWGGGGGSRAYASFDFLMLFVPSMTTPIPLAMASPNPFPAPPPFAFPAGTVVAIGNTDLISNMRLGAKFGGGLWLDPCHRLGLDGNFFFAGPAHRDIVATVPPGGSLWRPYTVINTPIPPQGVGPGNLNFADLAESIRVHTDSFLMGGDLSLRHQMFCGGCGNFIDLLVGFRYMHLDESLTVSESFTDPLVPPNGIAVVSDRFRTINNFYGGQIGVVAHKQWGPWSADLTLKVAAGTTQSVIEATGANNFVVNNAGAPVDPAIGLFVNDTNRGRFTTGTFSIVPEVGLQVGFNINPRTRLHIGYTGMYWSNVLRPGDQIDPIIDATKVPVSPSFVPPTFQPLPAADPHPVLPFRRSDFWAHGLNVGIDFPVVI